MPLRAVTRELTDMVLSREQFTRLVAEAIERLPPRFRERMQNVEVVVEEAPTREDLAGAGVPEGGTLYGLYQGVPLPDRGTWYGNVLPDRIVLFQRPIQARCRTRWEVRREIRTTLVHEIGHHFGLGEAELREAGVG
jgi:predicted Zn-dependent protease with MMP-like domain